MIRAEVVGAGVAPIWFQGFSYLLLLVSERPEISFWKYLVAILTHVLRGVPSVDHE